MINIKTKLEKLEHSRVKLEIEAPAKTMADFFEQAWQKIGPQIEIPGFRAGKAPKRLLFEKIGPNRFSQEVLDFALPQTYHQAITEHKLVPVQPPAISIINFQIDLNGEAVELKYTAEVDVLPEVKIKDYKKLKIKKIEFDWKPATKEEVATVVSRLQKENAIFEEKSGFAEKGDRVEINFEGKINGVAQENLTSKNHPVILGEGTLIPEFEKEIVGIKKGESKKFNIKMKDKKVDFEVEVTNIQKVILPPADDALAKKFNQKSFAELEKEIEKSINEGKERQTNLRQENAVMEKMLTVSAVELPESLVEQEINRLIESQRQNLAAQGLTLEQYLEKIKVSLEKMRVDLKPQAEKNIKYGLILGEIAKEMKLDLKDKEVGKLALDNLIKIMVK